jgi:hypothetical protein
MGVLDFMGKQDARGEWLRPRVSDQVILDIVPTLDAEHPFVYLRIRTEILGELTGDQKIRHATHLEQLEESGSMTFIVNSTTRKRKGMRHGECINHFMTVGVGATQVPIRSARIILREANVLVEECGPDFALPEPEPAEEPPEKKAAPKTTKAKRKPATRKRTPKPPQEK